MLDIQGWIKVSLCMYHPNIYEMDKCPLCDESFPEDRPRHRIVLEVEDTTRSSKQIMADETQVERYCVDQEVCVDCWDDLRDRLS